MRGIASRAAAIAALVTLGGCGVPPAVGYALGGAVLGYAASVNNLATAAINKAPARPSAVAAQPLPPARDDAGGVAR